MNINHCLLQHFRVDDSVPIGLNHQVDDGKRSEDEDLDEIKHQSSSHVACQSNRQKLSRSLIEQPKIREDFESYSEMLDNCLFLKNRYAKVLGKIFSDETIERIFNKARGLNRENSATIVEGTQPFLLTRNVRELSLYNTLESEQIGRGAYGTAYKIHNLVRGTFEVVKVANYGIKALVEMRREIYNLERLHLGLGGRMVKGLQDRPHIILQDRYIGKLYDCNLSQAINGNYLDDKAALNAVRQLLSGLCTIHTLGLLHGDIKSQNILVDLSAKTFHLSDLGGARFVDQLDYKPFCHTALTTSWSDINRCSFLAQEISSLQLEIFGWQSRRPMDKAKLVRLNHKKWEYVIARKAHDTFSLGCTLYELFSKSRSPYPRVERGYMNTYHDLNLGKLVKGVKSTFEDILKCDLRNQFTSLIRIMLSPNIYTRMTANQLHQMIEWIAEGKQCIIPLVDYEEKFYRYVHGVDPRENNDPDSLEVQLSQSSIIRLSEPLSEMSFPISPWNDPRESKTDDQEFRVQ